MKVFCVIWSDDYGPSKIMGCFSEFETAEKYADTIKPTIVDSVEILGFTVDKPDDEIEATNYYKHG